MGNGREPYSSILRNCSTGGGSILVSVSLPATLNAVFERALLSRVPRASWLVREGESVLAAHDERRWYAGASMIKTFLLAAALADVEAGRLRLEEPLEVLPEHRAGGDGVLRDFMLPTRLALADALHLMIALSDNTATNAVLAVVGLERLNQQLAAWGFGSRMRGFVDDGRPRAPVEGDFLTPPGLSVTSAEEHHRLLRGLRDGRLLSRLGPVALDLLAHQQDRRALARYVGDSVRFAHKTGTAGGARHDSGLLETGGREIAITVFTDGGPAEEWVDHPALVGMAVAMAGTAEELGLDLAFPAEAADR
jgi:beta-lactamase class A